MGWWIIPLAQYPWQLILARFIGGFCGGGIFAVVPVYITEISEDRYLVDLKALKGSEELITLIYVFFSLPLLKCTR